MSAPKRFGSIFPFLESAHQPRHIGRLVANYEFIKALLRYGTFDEYLFGNSSISNLKAFADTVRTWDLGDERLARVRYTSYAELSALLRTKAFHVFHLGGWGRLMAGLHEIRARHASNPWPITAVIHSLNGRDVVDHAVRLSHAGMAPCDAIFCTSRDGRDAMAKLLAGGAAVAGRAFQGRLEQLPLGIDDDLLQASGDRQRCRSRLRIPLDAIVLLVLGRITPFQKMDLAPLLRAFAHDIQPRSPRPVVLLLAGGASPDDLTLLSREIALCGIESSVKVYPNFPIERKRDVLAASDMLVSPVDNTQETFGLSLLEAMAAGLPVVASRFDGYKDLVDDGVDGFLVDASGSAFDPIAEWFDLMDTAMAQLFQSQAVAVDMVQLADRVLRLIEDDGLRTAMGAAGREKIDRRYRWSRVIASYEETWDRLASEAQRTGIPPAGENGFNLGSGRIFPHFPSRLLTADQRVTVAPGAVDMRPYNEAAVLLDPALLARLVARATASAGTGATIADLVTAAGVPEAQAWFAVLWLLKYDALRLG